MSKGYLKFQVAFRAVWTSPKLCFSFAATRLPSETSLKLRFQVAFGMRRHPIAGRALQLEYLPVMSELEKDEQWLCCGGWWWLGWA